MLNQPLLSQHSYDALENGLEISVSMMSRLLRELIESER
jgi:hypothetical protein